MTARRIDLAHHLVDPERVGVADDRGLVNRDGEKEVGVEMEHFRIQGQGASDWGLHGKD
jgi:hypothetical protein